MSLVIVTPTSFRDYTLLCRNMALEKLHAEIDVDSKVLKACARRVHAAHKLERLQHESDLTTKNESWMRRQADAAEILLSSDADGQSVGAGSARQMKRKKQQAHVSDEEEDDDLILVDGMRTVPAKGHAKQVGKMEKHPKRPRNASAMAKVDSLRSELSSMLAAPLVGPGRSHRFPLSSQMHHHFQKKDE